MATSKKTIVVVGGTGILGSSVARSLHDNPDFHVRVTTRDPLSAKAARLTDCGIEVVKADSWNIDELTKALSGCWGLFLNIDSDAPNFKQQIGPSELDMGRLILHTAAAVGIKHVVHASLPAATKLTQGRVPMVNWDDKAAISEYALKNKQFSTATILSAGWFLENSFDPKYAASFGGFAMIKDDDGFYTWKTPPMGNDPESVPFLAVADDYGDFVHGVFLNPQKWDRKYVHGVSESLSFTDMTAAFQRATGLRARYQKLGTGQSLMAGNELKTKEVNGLFDVMHAVQGRFFNGEVTEPRHAKELKAAVSLVRRGKTSTTPMTAEQFFRKYSPGNPSAKL
ncbi:unnamed protein product [Clonostachys byssicola]|uniref:NmrA-like domain-containing protein n=1 Tax=Clonostachys byssicola TaxID=160290 RepID=A0A9N9UQ38_9HYPO|nr:unnamed protein product [Clonostachys byssicola]